MTQILCIVVVVLPTHLRVPKFSEYALVISHSFPLLLALSSTLSVPPSPVIILSITLL